MLAGFSSQAAVGIVNLFLLYKVAGSVDCKFYIKVYLEGRVVLRVFSSKGFNIQVTRTGIALFIGSRYCRCNCSSNW
jgi:hypothetical protein